MAAAREYTPVIIETGIGADFARQAARTLHDKLSVIKAPLVALPTGSTPQGMYEELAAKYGDSAVWKKLRYLALDEYAGLAEDDERLFHRWMARALLDKVGVPEDRRRIFNTMAADTATEAARMESWITRNGPPDIVVLGIGANGHIGFNEPGSAFDSETRLVNLTPETVQANASYWGGVENVPKSAYTLGLKTLMQARDIILLVSGKHKADALEKALYGPVTEDLPASILRRHPNVTIIADKAALGNKPR